MPMFSRLARDRRGATAIEYALVASLIAIAAIGAFRALGTEIGNSYNQTAAALTP